MLRFVHLVNHYWFREWTSLRQMEPLRWTAAMDNYLRIIDEEKEAELDTLLVTQVKCQVITNQITSLSTELAVGGEGDAAPPTYYVKAMERQLQDIQNSLPTEMQSNSEDQASRKVLSSS
jgi:hypothetical protein